MITMLSHPLSMPCHRSDPYREARPAEYIQIHPVWLNRQSSFKPVTWGVWPQSLQFVVNSFFPPPSLATLVLVADRQHQRDKAAYNQRQHLHFAQSFPPTASGRVAVTPHASHLGKNVHRGYIQECASGKEHGHSSGVDIRKRLFTALKKDKQKA